MTVSEGQMMLETAYARPGFLRTIYLFALAAFVVWALTLVIGMFVPEVTIGLAAPGVAPTVWSRYGAALAIMAALAGSIALGIRQDRAWTQPLIPLAQVVDPLLDGVRAQPLTVYNTLAALSVAAVLALVLYRWPSSRHYYAVVAARERGIVSSFTS